MNPPPLVAVVGPTATGKSALAVELALRLGGEVVGADASQLYRGMDIGTAKITPDEMHGVPHHQLDVLDIHEEASVAAYQRHARADIDAVVGRGKTPILVGGSGLYVRAAVDHLTIPPTDAEVRTRIDADATADPAAVRRRLQELDPAAADAIEPNNIRRIVRALEVIELTGRPFSATLPRRESVRPTLQLSLDVPRVELDRRIGARVEHMWGAGLLDEVASLAERGLSRTRTAARAVGYPQALAHLRGELSRDEAVADTVAATRRLAKRQRQWFGADPRIVRLPVTGGEQHVLDAALAHVNDLVAGLGDPDRPLRGMAGPQ